MQPQNIKNYEAARFVKSQLLQLPYSIDNLLQFQEDSIVAIEGETDQVKAKVALIQRYRPLGLTLEFMESYARLPQEQKLEEYCRTVQILTKALRNRQIITAAPGSNAQQFQVYIKDGIIRRWWHKCRIQLDFDRAHATVIGTSDSSIDLHFYLMRKSKNKRKKAFALESTRPNVPRVVKIGLDTDSQYETCRGAFQLIINKATWDNLRGQILKGETPNSNFIGGMLPPSKETTLNNLLEKSRLPFQPAQPAQLSAGTYGSTNPTNAILPYHLAASDSISLQFQASQHPPVLIPFSTVENSKTALSERRASQPSRQMSITQQELFQRSQGSSEPFFSNLSIVGPAPSNGSLPQHFLVSNIPIPEQATEFVQSSRSLVSDPERTSARSLVQPIDEKCLEIMINFLKHTNLEAPPESFFSTILSSATYRIQRHKQRPNCFRLVQNLACPVGAVLAAIVEPANYPMWNAQIVKADTKLRIFKNNFTICKQTHRPWLQQQPPTEFLYLRHLCNNNNTTYLIDRSIDIDEFPVAENARRGNISSCIWTIQALDLRTTQLCIQLEMVLRSAFGEGQQYDLLVRYLEGMTKLEDMLVKREKFGIDASDYFDMNWPVGKKEESSRRIVITNHQSLRIKKQEVVKDHFDAAGEASFFSQQLSIIDDEAEILPYSNGRAITPKNKQFTISDDKLNTTPIQKLDQSFGEAVSPYFPARKTQARTEATHPAKLSRKITDEFGCELEKQMKIMCRQSIDNSTFTTQLEKMLSGKQSMNPESDNDLKSKIYEVKQIISVERPSISKEAPQVGFATSNFSTSTLNDTQSNKESSEGRKPVSTMEKSVVGYEYLKSRAQLWPITPYTYKPMKGRKKNSSWENFLEGYDLRFQQKRSLVCINQQTIASIQQAFRRLFETKSFTEVVEHRDMPISTLEEKSLLQRLARSLCFAPYYLEKAAAEPDSHRRFLAVAALGFTASLLQIDSKPPIPSVIGETFQGWLYGCPVYCQHISSSPDQISILFIGRGYRVSARVCPSIQAGAASLTYRISGDFCVQFDSYAMGPIKYSLASYEQLGLREGSLVYRLRGKVFAYETRDNLFAELDFEPAGARKNEVQGIVYQADKSFIDWFSTSVQRSGSPVGRRIEAIEGIWPNYLMSKQEVWFDLQRDLPCELVNEMYPIRSDSTYRADIDFLRANDLARAQAEKQELQSRILQEERMRHRLPTFKSHIL